MTQHDDNGKEVKEWLSPALYLMAQTLAVVVAGVTFYVSTNFRISVLEAARVESKQSEDALNARIDAINANGTQGLRLMDYKLTVMQAKELEIYDKLSKHMEREDK